MEINNAIHVHFPCGFLRWLTPHRPVIESVKLRAELMVIFRNSAHSSPVIYGRDPGAEPESRFLDRECRRLRHRSECLKPLLRKVVKRRGPKGWNYFRWTYADIVPRPALTRGVAGLSRIILYLARFGPFELHPSATLTSPSEFRDRCICMRSSKDFLHCS